MARLLVRWEHASLILRSNDSLSAVDLLLAELGEMIFEVFFSGTLFLMRRYEPIGTCIYCGAVEDLRDEHIIPKALNGGWILPKASCRSCEAITSKFEMKVLRGPLWLPRRALNLQTRHRDRQPESFPVSQSKQCRGKARDSCRSKSTVSDASALRCAWVSSRRRGSRRHQS
jgi:hypothetical protein